MDLIEIPQTKPKHWYCDSCEQNYMFIYKTLHQKCSKHLRSIKHGVMTHQMRIDGSRQRSLNFYYAKLSVDTIRTIVSKKIYSLHSIDKEDIKIEILYSMYQRICGWKSKIENMNYQIDLLNEYEYLNENEEYDIDNNNLKEYNEHSKQILINNISKLSTKIDKIIKLHFI